MHNSVVDRKAEKRRDHLTGFRLCRHLRREQLPNVTQLIIYFDVRVVFMPLVRNANFYAENVIVMHDFNT